MKRMMWLGCLSYFLIGCAHVASGAVLRVMLEHYELGYDQGGVLIFLQFTGFLIGVLTGPWWSAKLSRRGALTLSLVCLTVAEGAYSLLPPWPLMLTAAPVAGFGFGMIEAVIGALVIDASSEAQKATLFSRLEVLFGAGALAMPLLAGMFIELESWRLSFAAVAGFALAMTGLWLVMPMGRLEPIMRHREGQSGGEAPAGAGCPAASPPGGLQKQGTVLLVLFLAIFALYVGIEMSLVNFLPSMLVESLSTDDATASMSVTFFWVAMTVGRLYAGALAKRLTYGGYLLSHVLAAVVLLGLLLAADRLWSLLALISLLGIFMSGMFAIALIYANQVLPGRTERLTSLLIAAGGLGGALLPLFTGWSLKVSSVFGTLGVLTGLMALLLVLLAAIRWLEGQKQKRRTEGAVL
ncbi:MFS transporter [Paenibacillus sp. y28]|uniref:MFS transporter n=1 Tax=Paenibacillus sp. y28 TaxID=3129110 RepID=UPI0030189A7E